MHLYRTVNWYNWTALRHNLMVWVDKQDLVHRLDQNVFLRLDLLEITRDVPMLMEMIKDLNMYAPRVHLQRHRRTLTHDLMGKITMSPPNYIPVYRTEKLELNLCGGEYSWMVFYQADLEQKMTQLNGINYWKMRSDTAKEIDRVRIVEPTLLTTTCPYSVVSDRQFIDRVSLVLQDFIGHGPDL